MQGNYIKQAAQMFAAFRRLRLNGRAATEVIERQKYACIAHNDVLLGARGQSHRWDEAPARL